MVSNKNLKIFILLFSLVSAMFSYYVWQVFKTPNFRVEANQPFELFISEILIPEKHLKRKFLRQTISLSDGRAISIILSVGE